MADFGGGFRRDGSGQTEFLFAEDFFELGALDGDNLRLRGQVGVDEGGTASSFDSKSKMATVRICSAAGQLTSPKVTRSKTHKPLVTWLKRLRRFIESVISGFRVIARQPERFGVGGQAAEIQRAAGGHP